MSSVHVEVMMMMIVREMLELIELEQLELDLEPNGKKKAGPEQAKQCWIINISHDQHSHLPYTGKQK